MSDGGVGVGSNVVVDAEELEAADGFDGDDDRTPSVFVDNDGVIVIGRRVVEAVVACEASELEVSDEGAEDHVEGRDQVGFVLQGGMEDGDGNEVVNIS